MQLTPHQNEALSKLKDFIQGEEHQLFVLSGFMREQEKRPWYRI